MVSFSKGDWLIFVREREREKTKRRRRKTKQTFLWFGEIRTTSIICLSFVQFSSLLDISKKSTSLFCFWWGSRHCWWRWCSWGWWGTSEHFFFSVLGCWMVERIIMEEFVVCVLCWFWGGVGQRKKKGGERRREKKMKKRNERREEEEKKERKEEKKKKNTKVFFLCFVVFVSQVFSSDKQKSKPINNSFLLQNVKNINWTSSPEPRIKLF